MLPAFPRDAPLKFKTKSNVKSSSSYFATLVQNVKMLMQSVYSYHFKCALEKINPLTQTLTISLSQSPSLFLLLSFSLSLSPSLFLTNIHLYCTIKVSTIASISSFTLSPFSELTFPMLFSLSLLHLSLMRQCDQIGRFIGLCATF